jgi:hypothetical protein
VIHTIKETPPNVRGLIALSTNSDKVFYLIVIFILDTYRYLYSIVYCVYGTCTVLIQFCLITILGKI